MCFIFFCLEHIVHLQKCICLKCLNFTQDHKTPLHIACEKGHTEVVELLLAHEADVEAKDASGNTPLHVAAQSQQTKIVQKLLDTGADPDPENAVRF